MLKKLTLFISAILLYNYANAQTLTDSVKKDSIIKHSPIKTLTYDQYNALLKGDGLYNMALAGELNHYPMPDKALKYKKQLDLSPTQISKLNTINTELHRKKLEMGGIIINNERTIDSLFRTRQVYDGNIIFYANRYGLYQGELRNTILQACYATEKLLAPAQIKRLEALENHK